MSSPKNSAASQQTWAVSILEDTTFQTGFLVNGKEHSDGIIGKLFPTASPIAHPAWYLAQWACSHNIVDGTRTQQTDGYAYSTYSQTVQVSADPQKPLLTLELKASREYASPRVAGQEWPHLLVEQKDLQTRCPTLDKVKNLQLHIEARVPYCTCKMENPDPSLHAAQVNLFFTVSDLLMGDMYWFGVPLYDNRYELQPEYMAVDGGKADASNKFVYIAAQSLFTGTSLNGGEWVTYDKDIYPLIVKGLQYAKKRGYLAHDDPASYALTTMNVGWEMPGTYDGSFELRALSLNATVSQKVS